MENQILEILKRLESKVDNIEKGQKENTQILRALEHSSEVNKSEHDKMSNDIAHIKGNITCIREDLSTVELVTATNYKDIAKLKAVK